jgi:hypothetical protein
MKDNYVRGFKEALEWVLHTANAVKTLQELLQKVNAKYIVIMDHHITNINEEFPSKDVEQLISEKPKEEKKD